MLGAARVLGPLQRRSRLEQRLGLEFAATHTELVGHSACWGPLAPPVDSPEVLLRLSVRDRDRAKIEAFGKLNIAVSSAGVIRDGLVLNLDKETGKVARKLGLDKWQAVIDTNLTGTFLVSQAAFHHWMGSHGGSIVSIVADMWNGFPGMAHTGAARAAVVNLTQTLAVEWAEQGIRVNAVAPGFVTTELTKDLPDALQDEIRKRTPLGRFGTADDIAGKGMADPSSMVAAIRLGDFIGRRRCTPPVR